MKTNITKLALKDFRNHDMFSLSTNKDIIFIHGRNGVGKTSVLEAISLFSPGKGMLGASPASQCRDLDIRNGSLDVNKSEMGPAQSVRPFFVEIEINNSIAMQVESKVGSGIGRKIKVNDKILTKQTKILSWCDILWFNAKMQYDLHSSSYCRKFFDRISFYLYPDHANCVLTYEKLIKSRLATLQKENIDDIWLSSLERQIGLVSYDIAYHRFHTKQMLNNYAETEGSSMPVPVILFNSDIEERIGLGDSKEEITQFVMKRLQKERQRDAVIGQTMFGVHKTKVVVLDKDGVNFNLLSGGQQKTLILSLMYIIKDVIAREKARNPIILLDEMISFLDASNAGLFLERLVNNSSQIWITNPEPVTMPSSLDVEMVELF